jgi:Glycosyltransferase
MATVAGLFVSSSIVVLEETSDPQNRSKKANILLKAFSLRANAIQAISEEVADYLLRKTKINPKKITVIPNGVQLPKILSVEERSKLKEKHGLTKDDFVLGYVGRLHNDHKRFTDLLEAVGLIENNSVKLIIVGDGKDKHLLDSETLRLGIHDRVIHVGFQASPHPFYDMMDVLCVPSAREGFGLVAVEGMLHKLPIIASAVGGLKGVVKDGETGYHINPNSPQKLSGIISQLFAQPSLCHELGIKGYERAIEKYSADRYVENVKSLYTDLLKRGGFEFK